MVVFKRVNLRASPNPVGGSIFQLSLQTWVEWIQIGQSGSALRILVIHEVICLEVENRPIKIGLSALVEVVIYSIKIGLSAEVVMYFIKIGLSAEVVIYPIKIGLLALVHVVKSIFKLGLAALGWAEVEKYFITVGPCMVAVVNYHDKPGMQRLHILVILKVLIELYGMRVEEEPVLDRLGSKVAAWATQRQSFQNSLQWPVRSNLGTGFIYVVRSCGICHPWQVVGGI